MIDICNRPTLLDLGWLVKTVQSGRTEKPNSRVGWHTFHRKGLLIFAVSNDRIVMLKETYENTNGLNWGKSPSIFAECTILHQTIENKISLTCMSLGDVFAGAFATSSVDFVLNSGAPADLDDPIPLNRLPRQNHTSMYHHFSLSRNEVTFPRRALR